MRRHHLFLLFAGPTVLLVGPSTAVGDGGSEDLSVARHVFEMSDLDRDGTLSREEFAAASLERYGLPFEEYDGDEDDGITSAEYMELYRRIHSRAPEHEV